MAHDGRGWSQCRSKTRYRDEGDALGAAAKRRRNGASFLRVYECTYCNGWHLTHKPAYNKQEAA